MTDSMKLADYVSVPLIFVGESYQTSDDLFDGVFAKAFELGNVREDFLPRVKQRERTFPTGIQLENMGVAIPHTDAECILKEFVAVVVNKKPVPFHNMEDLDKTVEASVVFVLGLNQAHAQLEMLQSLMVLIQNDDVLNQIRQASSAEEVLTIIKQYKF